ncbi:MAG: hypothetical protein GKR90_02645 [Pseudomonadales bacterium]|nr:hypothetical protein [Pseudomonadales bacterium]
MIRSLSLIFLVLSASASALAPNERVGNFRLFDQAGGSHHLHYFSDKKAVVLLVQDLSCEASTAAHQGINTLASSYGEDVEYFVINSTSDRAEIAASSGEARVLVDDAQLVGRTMDLSRAGEVLVVNPESWTLAYRGDASDGLPEALEAVVAGEPVTQSRTQAKGCDIVYAPTNGHEISYTDTIAPILAENCVNCHRPGGIGPWAMTDYTMVRGFSLMMREVLMTKRMPPWHADPTIGHWSNDRSIGREEIQTLVSWIDAGSPRGEGEDPLTQYASHKPTWGNLGEPDLIVDIPPTDIPATGVVDYQYKYVTNPLGKDVWVRASQIVPGDRTVLHHVITRFGEQETEGPRAGRLKRRSSIGGGLAGYVPGAEARDLPEGTGTLLPAGATIEFQMHYTTSGAATTDHSRIGVYFHNEEPEHKINAMILANGGIKIPANTKSHSEQAIRKFDKDVLVYSILPHSHFRGKAAKFVANYPDGSSEELLNVPNYDFNWQTTYLLEEPKFMPAGTEIVYTNWWDNSSQNPANPNPNREVTWGQQSFDEMIFGAISYREIDSSEGDSLAGSE